MKSTSSKITIGTILITTIILLFVSSFTIYEVRKEIRHFADEVHILQQRNGGFTIIREQRRPFPELEKEFEDSLYNTIIKANVLALSLAILFGAIISKQITKPLNHLKNGIRKLKSNEYKFELLTEQSDQEFRDVMDEFNKLAAQLRISEELRRELISDISHEFKTPITSVLTQLEAMHDGVFEPDEKRLKMLSNQMERLNELVDALNEYTRVRSKSISIEKVEINLLDFVLNFKQIFESKLKDAGIELEIDIDKTYVVSADGGLLTQVFNNLIENAIKYSKGTKIRIYKNQNRIYIEDNGQGLADKDLKLIFERFYRVDKSRNRKTGGLGLGLSIVREIIEAHGWKIKAETVNPSGLKFVIEL